VPDTMLVFVLAVCRF